MNLPFCISKALSLAVVGLLLNGTLFSLQHRPTVQQHTPAPQPHHPSISEKDAESIGIEAYIYGYPLVLMDQYRRVMTNVASPDGIKAPMGQFVNVKNYPDTKFTDDGTPNADALFSSAWLDVSTEPYILHLPEVKKRYYSMSLLSGWTNIIATLGTRNMSDKAENYAITGPGWKGTLPKGVKEIKSPTDIVWIIGRTYTTGTPKDFKEVHSIQDNYKLTPFKSYGHSYSPKQGTIDKTTDMTTRVIDQVNSLDASSYFNKLAALLKKNPPSKSDSALLAKIRRLGIDTHQDFDFSKLDPSTKKALERAAKSGLAKIKAFGEKGLAKGKNNWAIGLKNGAYGTDYVQRAFAAYNDLGVNLPEEELFPKTTVDSHGQPLDGTLNRYVMHFPKGQFPPVNGFWSIASYSGEVTSAASSLERYAVGPANKMKVNSDGSLDLFIQNETPGKDKKGNWLPIPKGKFTLVFQAFWPERTLVEGTWQPPAVQKHNEVSN